MAVMERLASGRHLMGEARESHRRSTMQHKRGCDAAACQSLAFQGFSGRTSESGIVLHRSLVRCGVPCGRSVSSSIVTGFVCCFRPIAGATLQVLQVIGTWRWVQDSRLGFSLAHTTCLEPGHRNLQDCNGTLFVGWLSISLSRGSSNSDRLGSPWLGQCLAQFGGEGATCSATTHGRSSKVESTLSVHEQRRTNLHRTDVQN